MRLSRIGWILVLLCSAIVLTSNLSSEPQSKDKNTERVPSSAEQRAKFIEFATQLEIDPLGKDAQAMRAASIRWLSDVTDIKVTVCNLVPGILGSKKNYSNELFGQMVISSGAFVAEYPDLTDDHLLVNTAGVVGTLNAYQAILKSRPDAKWPILDDLLQKGTDGDLPAYVQEATTKCKETLLPDDEGKQDKVAAANDHLHRGNKFFDQGRYQLALIEYRRATNLLPDQHNGYHELSQTFYGLKNFPKAIEYANQAIRLNPNCWLCYQALGNIYDDSGKPEDALVQYRKAVDLAPNSGRPLYNYALTLRRLDRKPEAISALQRAVAVDPQYASPYRLLGDLLAERGELYSAREQFEKFVSIERSGDRFDKVSGLLKPGVHLDGDKLKKGDPQVDSYAAYGLVRVDWIVNEYKKRNPSEALYRRTVDEELAALKREAEKWRETKKSNPAVKDADLDRLLTIVEAGKLEPFVYTSEATFFGVEAQAWQQANPKGSEDFKTWATANSVSVTALQQPVHVEWLGGER